MLERFTKWVMRLRRDGVSYEEFVSAPITTTDATPTPWTAIEIVPDTTSAGAITVRYVIQAVQSDGSNLYSITSEASWSWPAGGPVGRRATASGAGTSSANTFAVQRPTHSFDLANVRPTITGKAGVTIIWSCNYRAVHYTQ
jgi:hypothetical protein